MSKLILCIAIELLASTSVYLYGMKLIKELNEKIWVKS